MKQVIKIMYITFSSESDAEAIALALLENKLIACANIFPVKSMYRWKEALQKEQEVVLLVKTVETKYHEIENFIKQMHPYTTPCIAAYLADINESYFNFVKDAVC